MPNRVAVAIFSIWGVPQGSLQPGPNMSLAILAPGGQMTPRWPQKAHFEQFCHWWPTGSQVASEGSFQAILAPGCRMAPRWPQKAYFEQFWHLVTKWLPDGLRMLILSNSGSWWSHTWLPDGLRRLILSNSGTR